MSRCVEETAEVSARRRRSACKESRSVALPKIEVGLATHTVKTRGSGGGGRGSEWPHRPERVVCWKEDLGGPGKAASPTRVPRNGQKSQGSTWDTKLYKAGQNCTANWAVESVCPIIRQPPWANPCTVLKAAPKPGRIVAPRWTAQNGSKPDRPTNAPSHMLGSSSLRALRGGCGLVRKMALRSCKEDCICSCCRVWLSCIAWTEAFSWLAKSFPRLET